ncbi:MAG: PIN domain-containing protein [Lautropia sp.]
MAQIIVRDLEDDVKARLKRRAAQHKRSMEEELSMLMHRAPEAAVVAWVDRQPAESVWITSVTLLKVRLDLALLPAGRRRQALQAAFARLLEEDLENRVLDFDAAAATEATALAAERRRAGHPVDIRDTQIAGIALARRATLATRNLRHFADLKVPVVDPWTD